MPCGCANQRLELSVSNGQYKPSLFDLIRQLLRALIVFSAFVYFRFKRTGLQTIAQRKFNSPGGLWLKAVTEPNSAKPTAIAEWARAESTGKDGNVRFFDTGI